MRAAIRNRDHRRGFTLIELMIVVALIGILASTAITSFMRYQWRSKRAEAYSNLESIRKVQLAYETEFGAFVDATVSPGTSAGISQNKQNWAALDDGRFPSDPPGAGFDTLGWRPEGATYFDYDAFEDDQGDGPMFTAAAYGDVDGDGAVSIFLYVYPDRVGNTAPCGLCPGGGGSLPTSDGPPLDIHGDPVLNQVVPFSEGDDY